MPALDKARETYYDNYNELFKVAGYAQLMDELATRLDEIKDTLAYHPNAANENIRELRGQAVTIRQILDFEGQISTERQAEEADEIIEDDLEAEDA